MIDDNINKDIFYETGIFDSGYENALNDLYTRLKIIDEKDTTKKPKELRKERSFLRDSMEQIKIYHKPTWDHCVRTALKCYRYGKWKEKQKVEEGGIEWNEAMTRGLVYAALLHDYGKIKMPLELLIKSEGLKEGEMWTDEDKKQMDRHPGWSYNYLMDNDHKFSAEIALRHHLYGRKEKRYPNQLPPWSMNIGEKTQKKIKLCSRILNLVDWFDSNKHRDNGFDEKGNALEKSDADVIRDIRIYYKPLPKQKKLLEEIISVVILKEKK